MAGVWLTSEGVEANALGARGADTNWQGPSKPVTTNLETSNNQSNIPIIKAKHSNDSPSFPAPIASFIHSLPAQ